jgi:diguanylate cyclase (GGDEF)-like protein/PAS domain S-box-containing protein
VVSPNKNNKNKWLSVMCLLSFPSIGTELQSAEPSISLTPNLIYLLGFFNLCILLFLAYSLIRFRRYQLAITQSEERLQLSLWASGVEMWDWHIETGSLQRTSDSGIYELPKVPNGVFPPNKTQIHPDDLQRVSATLTDHINGLTDDFECAYRLKSSNKGWSWILDRGKVVTRDDSGKALRMSGTFKDIQQLKQTENELKIFAQSIESIAEGVVIFDELLNVVHVNPGYVAITGRTPQTLVGNKLKFNHLTSTFIQQVKSEVDRTGLWQGDISGQRDNGNMYLAYVTVNCIKDQVGRITHYVAIVSDTTKRKKTEAKLIEMARADSLTGLPNRNVFFSNLQKHVQSKLPASVLVFDIDDFKKINDSLGHQTGDTLLKQIATRILKLISRDESLYRLGGDEFAVVMEKTNDIHNVTLMAKRILKELSSPFHIDHHEFVVAGSIGIVLYPDDGYQPETLLKNADTAMYHAKEDGNKYLFFNADMNKKAVKRLQIENLIRVGLKENYFHVYYQPKANLKTGQLSGMEALVRFITPKKGLISPGTFVPIAEETGQIVEIGDVVLRKACQDMKRWVDAGIITGRVAVNLSARQFTLPDLTERIDNILKETGLNPKNLELEITEGTVMNNPQHAIKIMHQLRDRGIHLALDDFGTGYSSLSYLRKFPLNTLKIDRAFVEDSNTSVGKAMIDTIITIARNLSLSTVAEGVETEEQKEFMQQMDCDVLQGYLYSKPLSGSEFSKFANHVLD